MNESRRQELQTVYRYGLLQDVIPFWLRHAVDAEYGGVMTAVGRDGATLDTDKGVWQQGRFTWLMSKLYNQIERRDEWLEQARRTIQFIERRCFDPADGRMWFHVTREGAPIRKRRYAFGESFAAIAFAQYAKAIGSDEYAEKAKALFHRFVQHHLNPPGVAAKFTDVRPLRGIGFPMITINAAQELRESIGLEDADEWIDRSIDAIRTFHVKEDLQCVLETVGAQGEVLNHFDGRTLNPGHAIEAAWFIMREGGYRGDGSLVRLGCQMLDWMWRRGWDQQYGGILYYVDLAGLPVQEYWHDMKFWWPQNEAIIATLMAYRLTGEKKYAAMHQRIHDWAHLHFPDPEYGEWYGYLHRDGSVSTPLKGNLWKGPFHLPRMQLLCWQMLRNVDADATSIVLHRHD